MSEPTRSTQQQVIRLALVMALAGLVTMMSGGVLLVLGESASADPGGQVKVSVCHRTASETSPYTYISVPEDEANGHITGTDKQHNTQVVWKSDGTWRGVDHKAGDPKLDYYAHDDEIAAGKCFDPQVVPPQEPEQVTPEPPTFSDACDPGNEELVVPEGAGIVDYTVAPRAGDTITVTATSADPTKFVLLDPESGEVVDTVTWTFTVDDQPCPTEPTPTEPTPTDPTPTEPTPTTTPTEPTPTTPTPTTAEPTPTAPTTSAPPEVAPSTSTPTTAPEEPGEDQAEAAPAEAEPADEAEAPEVLPAEASQGPTKPGQVPTAIDAGYYTGWSTTEVWGAALLGGGIALLLAAGTVLTAARKE